MVNIMPIGGGGTGAPNTPSKNIAENADVSVPFILDDGTTIFAPDVFPNTLRATKERNINRSSNFCGGEDVSDQGMKNKDIHVSGYVKQDKTASVWNVVNEGALVELTSPIWSGEVRVKETELSGPSGYDPDSQKFYFEYVFDLVSTGKDEPGGPENESGIISSG